MLLDTVMCCNFHSAFLFLHFTLKNKILGCTGSQLWHQGSSILIAVGGIFQLQHVGSSFLTRNRTPWIGRVSPSHWTTRDAPPIGWYSGKGKTMEMAQRSLVVRGFGEGGINRLQGIFRAGKGFWKVNWFHLWIPQDSAPSHCPLDLIEQRRRDPAGLSRQETKLSFFLSPAFTRDVQEGPFVPAPHRHSFTLFALRHWISLFFELDLTVQFGVMRSSFQRVCLWNQ